MTLSSRAPSKRLFIGSLPYRFTEGELLSLFAPYGRIVALKIMHNRWGKSRGLGFVEYDNQESALRAKSELHHHQLTDRTMIVDFAQPDPFLTPEGQQRHLEAQKRHPPRKSRLSPSSTSGKSANFPPGHIRQSVFNSRRFNSRIGAKFASRTKHKK